MKTLESLKAIDFVNLLQMLGLWSIKAFKTAFQYRKTSGQKSLCFHLAFRSNKLEKTRAHQSQLTDS